MKKESIKTKLKRGDMVQVVAGKDIGREGRIMIIDRVKNKAIVEGLNLQTKHQKPNRANQSGGITRREAPIHLSNVMYLHKGKVARLSYQVETAEKNGKKVTIKRRVAKVRGAAGEVID